MKGLTDIHMHIIPGVDDGARDMEEAIEELQMSVRQGVERVVLTPHNFAFDDTPDEVEKNFTALKNEVKKLNLSVELFLGCEMLVFEDSVDECVRKLIEGIYPTMAGSTYVLTEFVPDYHTAEMAFLIIDRLVDAGYVPIIAHTERYDLTTLEVAREMVHRGALIQINAYSVKDEGRARTRDNANMLLREKLVGFIGTDAHRLSHRPPVIESGVKEILRLYGEAYAEQIFRAERLFT